MHLYSFHTATNTRARNNAPTHNGAAASLKDNMVHAKVISKASYDNGETWGNFTVHTPIGYSHGAALYDSVTRTVSMLFLETIRTRNDKNRSPAHSACFFCFVWGIVGFVRKLAALLARCALAACLRLPSIPNANTQTNKPKTKTKVVLQYQQHPNADPELNSTYYQRISTDDGLTWGAERDITGMSKSGKPFLPIVNLLEDTDVVL